MCLAVCSGKYKIFSLAEHRILSSRSHSHLPTQKENQHRRAGDLKNEKKRVYSVQVKKR